MTEKEEEIIKQFKMKKINLKLKEGIFCGYRGVTISSRELTELQKLKYATLAETIFKRKPQVASGYYIDIDELIKFISVNEDFSYGPCDLRNDAWRK